jgi:hypothetical protein
MQSIVSFSIDILSNPNEQRLSNRLKGEMNLRIESILNRIQWNIETYPDKNTVRIISQEGVFYDQDDAEILLSSKIKKNDTEKSVVSFILPIFPDYNLYAGIFVMENLTLGDFLGKVYEFYNRVIYDKNGTKDLFVLQYEVSGGLINLATRRANFSDIINPVKNFIDQGYKERLEKIPTMKKIIKKEDGRDYKLMNIFSETYNTSFNGILTVPLPLSREGSNVQLHIVKIGNSFGTFFSPITKIETKIIRYQYIQQQPQQQGSGGRQQQQQQQQWRGGPQQRQPPQYIQY